LTSATNRGPTLAAAVAAATTRESRKVRAAVVPNVNRETLKNANLDGVEKDSTVYTGGYSGYDRLLHKGYLHQVINHTEEYVRGQVHTQGIDNFWSLLKRGLKGTYVAVEPFHLDRYLDEQVFRYNNRATKDNPLTDLDRFLLAVTQISGKRLTYKELTGGLPDLLYQEIVSVARRVKDMTRRSSRGCGKVGSDLCFPLFHAPGKLRSAMQPALVVCNPAMSEV
jgi:transposase-like protein